MLGASSAPPSAHRRTGAGKRDDRERTDVEPDELGGAARVGAGHERLSDDRPAKEERQRDGAEERDACDEHVLRLDEDAADVPCPVGDAGIAARDVTELEQEQCLGHEGGTKGDDRARETRRPVAKADGDDRKDRREERGEQDGHERREGERHVVGELEGEQPADDGEDALREVHDPRRPVDQHEAHPDEPEGRPRREPDDHELQELGHTCSPPRYAP